VRKRESSSLSIRTKQRGTDMFKVHHVFPSTGEWGSTEVETLTEAEAWYECKHKAKNSVGSVLTLYDPTGRVLKQETFGK